VRRILRLSSAFSSMGLESGFLGESLKKVRTSRRRGIEGTVLLFYTAYSGAFAMNGNRGISESP
jgi:hypothetical protein